MKDGAIASAADVAVALRTEGGAAAVPAERAAANRARHEVPRPHSVGPNIKKRPTDRRKDGQTDESDAPK